MMRAIAIVVALAAGCVSTDTTLCGGGARCLEGTECVAITFTDGLDTACVSHDQRVSCAALDDGEPCTIGMAMVIGTCHEHVCFPDACGNRLVDIAEMCDDGNLIGGDGCSGTCASNETCGNSQVDSITNETCDGGDWLSHDGCSSGCAAESPTWVKLETAQPPARDVAGLAYDVARRRVVVFGGFGVTTALSDTGEWDGRRWSRPDALPEPLPRGKHAMAYDAAREQLVVFGGSSGREMWLRDREGVWSLKTPTLRPPSVNSATMVYDAGRQRVVMFGGFSGLTLYDATWIWDGTTWTELTAQTRPPGRYEAAMAYDPKRGVVVLAGGENGNTGTLDDVWELDGDTWVERQPAIRPTARHGAAMTYDPGSERVVLVGGLVGVIPDKQTWAWDGQAWTRLADANVIAPDVGLFRHAMTTDAARGRMVLLGTNGDLQEWNGTQWTTVDQAQLSPPRMSPRCMHAAATDPLRREVVVFGGSPDQTGAATYGDTWIWSGVWRQAMVTPSPSPRFGASLTLDVGRRELVLFGGCSSSGIALADTWVWSGSSWSQRLPASSPPPRCNHGSAYDVVRGEIVMFGGRAAGNEFDDTWTWNGTTWTAVATAVRPTPRQGAAMAYDPVRAQVVLFGGNNYGPLGDTWTWNGQGWTEQLPASSPSPRFHTALAWDAARQRLVLFAGNAFGLTSADVWEWEGADWTLIPTAHPPLGRNKHTMVADVGGAGVLVIGGFTLSSASVDEVWRMAWDDRGVRELCTDADTDGDRKIGAADPDCWSTLTPLCPPATSCDPLAPHCGDGVCNVELESCATCAGDCGACAAGCGNFACDGGEAMASCPGDCGA